MNILNQIAQNSIYAKGLAKISTEYCGKIFQRHMVRGSLLELGPADGVMTEYLWERWREDYTAVDGAELFVEGLNKKYDGIKAVCSYFENYRPKRKFNNIILGHVLEHVEDPGMILKLCREWLEQDGVILAAVPNSNSLHRQAAVLMGLIKSEKEFSAKDVRHGHRRIFDYNSFNKLFIENRYEIIARGGYWLKPLSDSQIETDWDEKLIDAYLELGEKYPEIAGEVYIVAK